MGGLVGGGWEGVGQRVCFLRMGHASARLHCAMHCYHCFLCCSLPFLGSSPTYLGSIRSLLGSEGCAQFIFYSLSTKQGGEQYEINPGITKIAQS